MHESGYDNGDTSSQELDVYLSPTEAATLEARGVETTAVPIEPPQAKNLAMGDSPNPFFNVWRSYSEPGGIADEMRATAAANPDVMKLETLGVTDARQADPRDQDDRERAQRARTARVRRCCSRRSTTRASGSRPSRAGACRSGSRRTRTSRRSATSCARPSSGSCRSRTWTATTSRSPAASATAQVPCDYRVRPQDDNRFWRKTIRDNNGNGIRGDSQDGVDPNRNYPAKRAIDEEGASNSFSSGTYRGPYPLSEPGNLAVDRLQRRVKFYGNINYHTDGQLLLTPVSYTTDYAPPDSTIFAAMTGTDGDSAVFPYQPQRSSDLYESNGDTIDNALPELRDHRLDAGDGHVRHRRRPAELPRASATRTTRRR